jgi:hypothetical protein
MDIVEGQGVVVLVDLATRDLAAQDSGEYVVRVIGHGVGLSSVERLGAAGS